MQWAEWESGQAALPIYLLEWYPSDYALWNAADYPLLHTNDTDTSVTAIHHTLGTGTYQAARGTHTHTATSHWEPVTNGDAGTPEIVFHEGDVVMTEVIW